MEKLNKATEIKIQLLKITNEATVKILESRSLAAIERQRKTLETKLEEVHALKVKMQELKLEKGEELDEIREWSSTIEGKLVDFEGAISELKRLEKEIKSDELKGQEELAAETKRKQFEEELKFEQEKFERRLQHEKALAENKKSHLSDFGATKSITTTKLPKLVITKFNGQHTDWLRFWGQFKAEIEESEVSQVTKFSYLKELVEPKVRSCIDGLPFNSEGYERAKNILETKYGKNSEVINAHVQNIINLPTVQGTKPAKIHAFYETLLTSVQSLETLGKLKEVSGYVRMTIDKLEGIRNDLVRTDDDWQEWKYPELIEALRKWTVRNPVKSEDNHPDKHNKSKNFQTRQESKPRVCVYCDDANHRSAECKKVVTVADRRKILGDKQLCFNCTGQRHKAADCRSQQVCQHCKRRHHSSICNKKMDDQGKGAKEPEQMLVAKGENKVIYPVVMVKADGITCRALLDTGAGSSYASGALLDRLQKRPVRKEYKRIEMMMHSTSRMIEVHQVTISDLEGNFKLQTDVTKVDRSNLLCVENPKYEQMVNHFEHLKGIKMTDVDAKPQLPIHLILGASEYAKIKTATKPRVGRPGEPVAELTKFGWTLLSPGTEDDLTKTLFAKSSVEDYQKLCDLDVLGLQNQSDGDEVVYQDFKDQLKQNPEGWYETGLLWKPNTDSLPSNKAGSLARLGKLVQKLEKKPDLFQQYREIIKEQEEQGIIEKVTQEPRGREFYLPHKPVVRESAESTKVRIVYDASAKTSDDSLSLNDCLETGPALQNLLWNILVRNRFKPVALSADLKQAFLQIRVKEKDRDALRFHWINEENPKEIEVYRFTPALFGLNQSPFLLGGTLEQHLSSQEQEFPTEVAEIRDGMYVDDLLTGGCVVEEVKHLKETAIEIFDRAQFKLHKWHSNAEELETSDPAGSGTDTDQSYAKQQLGVKSQETKLLGVPWNKTEDKIGVAFPVTTKEVATKRTVLSEIASIFDPLGLVSPVSIVGKMIYRDICDNNLPWDKELSGNLMTCWNKWCEKLPSKIEFPRSLVPCREEVQAIDLHAFGDASGQGTCAAVYAVIYQNQGTAQGLVTAKSRLAKKGLTIPRLELVSGQMAMKLLDNVRAVLDGLPVRHCYGWLDSMVALYWISGRGSYKQFVANRVKLIREKSYITWKHVGSKDNPADIGSRGCIGEGPLTTEEMQQQIDWWLKREQSRYEDSDQTRKDEQHLNLKRNERGLLECQGRIQGEYPIYIPPESILAEKLVMHEHQSTLHGGVSMTMSAVREKYWIPRLRRLTKKVRNNCNGCKRFQTTAFAKPPTGNLPRDRTDGTRPFQVVGVDYAGPFIYKRRADKEGKAYLLLIGCSLTRAIHLEVVPDLSTEEFMHSFKRFIARRGKPDKVYSDNAKTFVAAAKRVRKISKDDQVNDYLARNNIKWQFNLSKAPWWGGQYERLIGLVKQSFYKVVGRSSLTWKELQEVILDVEICLNNRPLAYVEDDHELPVLTPNAMITGQPTILAVDDEESTEEEEMRKRAKHILKCKQAIWKRWTGEYLRALRERHDLTYGQKERTPKVGDVVLIKDDARNRGKWSVGIVEELYQGRDGVVRGAKLKTRKTHVDRALQHLYPLELHSQRKQDKLEEKSEEEHNLDPEAKEFRPRRNAATVARQGIQAVLDFENS